MPSPLAQTQVRYAIGRGFVMTVVFWIVGFALGIYTGRKIGRHGVLHHVRPFLESLVARSHPQLPGKYPHPNEALYYAPARKILEKLK